VNRREPSETLQEAYLGNEINLYELDNVTIEHCGFEAFMGQFPLSPEHHSAEHAKDL
jgi:hypothetical protein